MLLTNYINKCLLILIGTQLSFVPNNSFAQELNGIWQSQDKTTNIKIEKCSNFSCGKIHSFTAPIDPKTGVAWKDVKNPDKSLRNRSLVGIVMISEIKPFKNGWKGVLYNPLDGHNYNGYLRIESNNQLILSGCILGGMLCKSEIWHKIQ